MSAVHVSQHICTSLASDPISLEASRVHKSVTICVASYVKFKIWNLEFWLGIFATNKRGKIQNLTCNFWVVSDTPVAIEPATGSQKKQIYRANTSFYFCE